MSGIEHSAKNALFRMRSYKNSKLIPVTSLFMKTYHFIGNPCRLHDLIPDGFRIFVLRFFLVRFVWIILLDQDQLYWLRIRLILPFCSG